MTPAIGLPELIEEWINNDPILSEHFAVEARVRSAIAGIINPRIATHYISYACPNRTNLWAIVFINDEGIEGYFDKNIISASDPNFFEEIRKELIKQHDKNYNCKEFLEVCEKRIGKAKRR